MVNKSKSIMVVEDDPVISFSIRESLISWEHTVSAAVTSGEAAISAADENRPDLIIMDIKLNGEMSGIEAARRIRAKYDIPVIYLTAYSNEALFDRSMYTGPFGYLIKPVNSRDLKIAIDMAVYKHGFEKELKETNRRLEREIQERRKVERKLQTYQDHLEELVSERTSELEKEIHKRRRMENALKKAKEDAEFASRAKTEFLANMSHELRTPLNSIMALSRVLVMRSKSKLSGEESKYLEIIERSGKTLLELIDEILDLAKIESGRMDVFPAPVQIGEVVDIIAENLEPLGREKGIDIIRRIPGGLPAVETDELKINQILENIIGNAVKFTEQGTVVITVESLPDRVLIHVTDSGAGISENDLPHIFEEFLQADGSTARKFEGSGLGLAIAEKLSRLLGAAISVKSELGKGSTFTVDLPVKWKGGRPEKGIPGQSAAEGPEANTAASFIDSMETREPVSNSASALPESSKPPRILIIEDNPDNMITIKAVLDAHYEIIEALDGKKGLEKALLERPDLILLDMALPVMDGFTVVQHLKQDDRVKTIPVIALTAYAMKGDREIILKAGCDSYFTKPVNPEKISSEIKSLLAESAQ